MFNLQQKQIIHFVNRHHSKIRRKFTRQPYFVHLIRVATLCKAYNLDGHSVEVALCHDLLEDTDCSTYSLLDFLTSIGYSSQQASAIVFHVIELTDVFTKQAFPEHNRAIRKALEANRLSKVSGFAQSIKYVDLMDNIRELISYDDSFARTYMKEKKHLIDVMDKGNSILRALARLLLPNTIMRRN